MTNFNSNDIRTKSTALITIQRCRFYNEGDRGARVSLTVSLEAIDDNGNAVPFKEVGPRVFHIWTLMVNRRVNYDTNEYTETLEEAKQRFYGFLGVVSMALELDKTDLTGDAFVEHVASQINGKLEQGDNLCIVGNNLTTRVGQPKMVVVQDGSKKLRTPRFVNCNWVDPFSSSYYLQLRNNG